MVEWKESKLQQRDANDHGVLTLNSAMGGVKKGGINYTIINNENLNPLSYNGGPIIRARAKRMKEAIMGLVQSHLVNGQLMVNTKVKDQSQFMVNSSPSTIESSPRYVHLI